MRAPSIFVCLVVVAGIARSQSPRADLRPAETLEARTRDKVFRDRVEPNWLPGGDRFWYRVGLPGGAQEFVLVDAAKATRTPAFDHAVVAQALTGALGKKVRPTHLPFDRIELEADGKVGVTVGDKGWLIDPEARTAEAGRKIAVAEAPSQNRPRRRPDSPRDRPRTDSPDGRWRVEVNDHNLRLRNRKTDVTRPLTTDGTAKDGYTSADVFWASDSKHFVALRAKPGANKPVYLIESSPKDDPARPKLHSFPYPKPGDVIDQSWPRLFDADVASEIPVATELFPNPWSITDLRWQPDGKRFSFLYNERGHQTLRVLSVDATTGSAWVVIEERAKTFIDYAHKSYLHRLEPSNELIWMSERDGWNHLYLHDAATGRLKNPITSGEWVVRGVDRVDADKRVIWFRAGGVRPGEDPYHVHYCRANFDGTGFAVLTDGDGDHDVRPSPNGRWFVDTWSRVDKPPVTELWSADGAKVLELERADITELDATGWRPPERFVAKGRDGTTDIYGVIYRPSFHDPAKTYPVVEEIYAGPQGSFVPKRFARYSPMQALAELGFVVVKIDGMGTNWRSKAFHDVCWKNLGDSGFPDRIQWLKAAAAKDPSLDLTRVGIYGGSAGGQSAVRALLAHGDFYKAAVADCGCHDNRVDKIWWNELWMGWPVGPHYSEQSNVTNAHKLKGQLLLAVGELDRNVDPASTLQVVNALIKADKDFEFLLIPGAGHGSLGSPYGRRRQWDFFVRHLRPGHILPAHTPP